MPVLIEGIDLVAVAALFIVVGLLYTVKWWLRPAFNILDATIGHIPGVGSFVTKAENAVIGALDTAIGATQGAATDLFKGGINLAHLTGNALLTLATQVYQALDNLWHTRLPQEFAAKLTPIRLEIAAVIGSIGEINDRLTDGVNFLDDAVNDLRHKIANTIEPTIHDLAANIVPRIESEIHDVRNVLHNEIGELARATGKTVDALEHDLTIGLQTTAQNIIAARSAVEGEITEGISAAEAFSSSAAGAIEQELSDYENLVPLAQIGTIIAAWPFVYSLAQSLVTEAGLGNEACRRKVNNVCGVPEANWTNLLAGLAIVGLDFSLDDILEVVETVFDTVIDDVIDFATG